MIIKLISKFEESGELLDNKILNLLSEYRNQNSLDFLTKDLSLLSSFHLTFEVEASANFFFNIFHNKDLNLVLSSNINGIESFNILIDEKQEPLKQEEIKIIKQYISDGYGMFLHLSQKQPTTYSLANILPFCHKRKGLVSSSLKGWIEFILLLDKHKNNNELIDIILFSLKIKNLLIDLAPNLSKVFKLEKELEINYINSDLNKQKSLNEKCLDPNCLDESCENKKFSRKNNIMLK